MQANEFNNFRALLTNVFAFYNQDITDFALDVWWEALKQYDFAAIKSALNRHCVNPDNGQFLPKPADVVKLLQGSTNDSALVAWAKVDKAVKQIGGYASVVFDDPIIHATIDDMGGWIKLCSHKNDEWAFVAKEFENRYRGYKITQNINAYSKVLIGRAEAENNNHGFKSEPPVLIGDSKQALLVLQNGTNKSKLEFKPLSDVTKLISNGMG